MADCEWWNYSACTIVNGATEAAANGALDKLATATLEATGKAFASVGTVWVHLGTPDLTGSGSTSITPAKTPGAFSLPVLQILSWTMWISLVVMVITLVILGAMMTVRHKNGDGALALGRFGIVLGGVFIVSGASALVAGLLPSGPQNVGGTVAVIQSALWWLMLAVAAGSLIVGAMSMVWNMRGEAAREITAGVLRLVVVVTSGTGFIAMFVLAGDLFSVWLLGLATDCDLKGDSACFGRTIAGVLALSSSAGGLGVLMVIVLGIVAWVAAIVQIILMLVRSGMIVTLTGLWPTSAALGAGGSKTGEAWFQKNLAWLVAFILYKPAAAIVYAVAFLMAGADLFKDDGTGLISVLTGLMMMVLALVALPALMRFVSPMVSVMASAAGGGMAGAAAGAVAAGAVNAGRLFSGGGGGSGAGAGGSDDSSGPDADGAVNAGSAGGFGGSGAPGASGSGSAGPEGSGPSGTESGQPASGASGAGAGAGAGASEGAAAGGAGTAAGAGAGAGGAASAGAAAGPWGAVAGAALDTAQQAGDAAKGAAQGAVQETTGESS